MPQIAWNGRGFSHEQKEKEKLEPNSMCRLSNGRCKRMIFLFSKKCIVDIIGWELIWPAASVIYDGVSKEVGDGSTT